MSIKDWPKSERPREKLLNKGATHLSDAELIAIFLRTGTRDKTALDLARDLLTKFGSLQALMTASLNAIQRSTAGIGQAKYITLQASLEMSRRYLFEQIQQSNILTNSQGVKRYLRLHLGTKTEENFGCLFLDIKNKLLGFKILFSGGLNYTNIYPRKLVKAILANEAASVIFVHNHPSGQTDPSPEDLKLTERLRKMLELIEVRVLDHIIIGKFDEFSFKEHGLL
jgi:DNA repair protein RadC